jgi:hypothetical protein
MTRAPELSRTSRRPSVWLARLHFLIRLLGLVGLVAACVGLFVSDVAGGLGSWQGVGESMRSAYLGETYPAALEGQTGPLGANLLAWGLALAGFALLVELLVIARYVAARRSALGFVSVVQVVLAVALWVAINIYSMGLPASLVGQDYAVAAHFEKQDWTRDGDFTLPREVTRELAKLKDPTTVVVYLRHRDFDSAQAKPDRYSSAAERKVVEKVQDLAGMLRDVGPDLRVEVLDVEDETYDEKFKALEEAHPGLGEAIQAAPENSIFFASRGLLERMSFSDFYRLDRTSSLREENLVLRSAGVRPVTDRILNLESRRPRIALLVFHEALGSEGALELYSLAEARKALEARGFEVRDIITRREEGGRLVAAVDTLEDARLDRLRDEQDRLEEDLRLADAEITMLKELIRDLPSAPLDRLNEQIARYARRFNLRFVFVRVREGNRKSLEEVLGDQLAAVRENRQRIVESQEDVRKELQALDPDRIAERRRITDLGAKLERALADCDMLWISRLTILRQGLPISRPELHDLNAAQAGAIKDFLRSGKPVLATFGPVNMPELPLKEPDEVEKILGELGVRFGKRTVLYEAEKRDFSDRRDNPLRASKPLRLPPLLLKSPEVGGLTRQQLDRLKEPAATVATPATSPLLALPFLNPSVPKSEPNPVRESLRLAARDSGGEFTLTMRFPRQVFVDPLVARRLDFPPELLQTTAETWNDDSPFSTAARPVPRFEPPPADDPDNNTPFARRRGPFTVGVALEAEIPADWKQKSEGSAEAEEARVIALGNGGLFTNAELNPAREKLLVDCCNWLLGRDDRLAREGTPWRYPRVQTGEGGDIWLFPAKVWRRAFTLGPPLLFAFFGLVVLLFRRLR